MSETDPIRYCAELVREHRPDTFFASLYLAKDCRDVLNALVALDIEVAHIRVAVKEELIAHIRYAWWEDALQKTYAGNPPRGHMVLEAWGAIHNDVISQDSVMALLHEHRSHYPDIPEDEKSLLVGLAQVLIAAHGSRNEKGWQKASGLIAAHRKKYENRRNAWLYLKLLAHGMA